MFRRIINRIKKFYYKKIKKIDDSDYNICMMRKRGIIIGEGCRMFTQIGSLEPTLISIGDNVTVSADVSFCTHDNAIIKAIEGKTDVVGKISIGNDCFIGMRSIIMYGVTLGDNCIVGAGSVVTRSFPPHTVLAGNPAKAICTTEEYAEKYKDFAIDFKKIPMSERPEFFEEHPELLVKR